MDLVISYLNHNSETVISFLLSFSGFVFGIILLLWFYNKKKFNALKHQIPADVVKNYLDSIIQNSTSLKSSLFRGGGLDVTEGIPAVMPVRQMSGGESLAVGSNDSSAELHQRNAEIATLRSQVNEKKTQMIELEGQCSDCNGKLAGANNKVKELEAQLAQAKAGGGGGADPAALAQITKERDDLKEKLEEYSIIEDDLANLKRLKQENEQLRNSLGMAPAAAGAVTAPAPTPEPAVVVAEEPAPAVPAAEADYGLDEMAQALSESQDKPSDVEPAAPAAVAEEEKTPEDLLSEFEKMLG